MWPFPITIVTIFLCTTCVLSEVPPTSITDVLAGIQDLSEFYTQIKDSPVLNSTSDFTLFAPTNAAVRRFQKSRHLMDACLSGHVITGTTLRLADLMEEKYKSGLETMDPDKQISFTYNNQTDTFTVHNNCGENANIVQPNIAATNGIIHKIDGLLCGRCPSPVDALLQFDDLSEFHDLLTRSQFLKTLNEKDPAWTLLVPTNEAVQRYRKKVGGDTITDQALTYHFIQGAKTIHLHEVHDDDRDPNHKVVNQRFTTRTEGQLPIWLTKTQGSNIFLNDAVVDPQRRNLMINSNNVSSSQIFHVIDQFLEPVIYQRRNPTQSDLNPNAFSFISNLQEYPNFAKNLAQHHTINQWVERISSLKIRDIFQWSGGHTYFIPVDKAFEAIPISSIDNDIIEGNFILNQVLFLRPTAENGTLTHNTVSNSHKVQINSVNQTNASNDHHLHHYVVNSLITFDPGMLQSEVVLGNIPVDNGVIHLISKPLHLNLNIYKMLQLEEWAAQFYKLIFSTSKLASPMLATLKLLFYRNSQLFTMTVLVPSNDALISKPELMGRIQNNVTLLEEFLRCHILFGNYWTSTFVDEPLIKESIAENKTKIIFKHQLLEGEEGWIFTVGIDGRNDSTRKIITSNLMAMNGLIHRIDGVLDCGSPLD